MEGGEVEEPETRFANTATLGSFRVQTPFLTGWCVELSVSPHCSVCAVTQSCLTLTPWTIARQAPLSMGFPGENIGVGCHFLLQGIFHTQGSNSSLLCLLLHW